MIAGIVAASWFSDTVREVAVQGLGYLFAFVTTPFVLEASAAFIGLCIVFIVNNRRIAKEGDGWVEMEVKDDPRSATDEKKNPADTF